uniref:Uncharacterized protein n=1 Tax=Anguilla anguilla TaxID=7936 RepID=A0A0E9S6C4_ANGAN
MYSLALNLVFSCRLIKSSCIFHKCNEGCIIYINPKYIFYTIKINCCLQQFIKPCLHISQMYRNL